MRIRSRAKIFFLIWSIVLGLTACNGSGISDGKNTEGLSEQDSVLEQEEILMKEVVFLNRIADGHECDAYVWGYSGLYHRLSFDEEYDEDTLFAYDVQYEKVFLKDAPFEGYYLGTTSVIRPDMKDIVDKVYGNGSYENLFYNISQFDKCFEELVPLLGTDKNRVTLSVPVIPPEEKVPTNSQLVP